LLVAPETTEPFLYHWYELALLAVAVNVTEVPAHIVVVLADIETEGTTVGLTVSVIVLLVAVVGDAQVALLVITQ